MSISRYNPSEEATKHGIKPYQPDAPLPESTRMSPVVQQKHLEYFVRELGRPMDEFEFKVLEEMLLNLEYANRRLTKAGQLNKVRGSDDLMVVFVERVKLHIAKASAGILAGQIMEENRRG